jgi:hypothetical protein
MPEGAVEPLPGGERSGTFVRLVPVIEDEDGHGEILARQPLWLIGDEP